MAKLPKKLTNFPIHQRHDDLKIHSAPYREHEIVWFRLNKAHVCPTNAKVQITHWPAEILVKTLKIETHHVEIVSVEDMNGDRIDIPQPVNVQYYMYTVSLMGLEGDRSTIECRVENLLPWVVFYTPEVMRGIQAAALLRRQNKPLESLDPDKEDFHKVLTTWAWARHWADAVRAHFSPFGLFFDSETLKKLRRKKTGGFFNGTSKKKRTRAKRAAREKEMLRELEMIAANVQHYQGVWFGSEKIWVGDMVRLAGTFEKPASSNAQPVAPSEESIDVAHLQLYKGRSVKEGRGPLVKLEGFKIDAQSLGRPAFFQVTHIYRVPGHNDKPGSLQFDGIYYELVKQDIDETKKPPSLYGDMQGFLDTSDTSSSSTTDQNVAAGPNGELFPHAGIPGLYRKELLPPAPVGYAFKPLKKLPGFSDEDGPGGLLPYMIAG